MSPRTQGASSPPDPIVTTRIRAPRHVANWLSRERLSERLDRGLDDRARLILLSAPPGYGKSVTITGWLASRKLDHAWLSLDAGDVDPARFVRYLTAALGPVRAAAGQVAAGLFGPGASPTPHIVGATLVEALAASDEPFVLVLDDYHAIANDEIHQLVRFLVERGPPFCHLVIVTREDPPLPLARLRAHGQLIEVRAEDLRFTQDEAAAFLATAGVTLDAAGVELLVERTEGWIAGLQLAALALHGRSDAATRLEAIAGTRRFVLDYLTDEIMTALDDELRQFLVASSVAHRFDAGLCRSLTGREDAAELIDQADRANLFLIALDPERRWFRFHHLFADYLRSQLDEPERCALHLRAADYLEGAGQGREAIGHALAAGSAARATRIIAQQARPAFEAGELATLMSWLESLPRDQLEADAELPSWLAWSLFQTGRAGEAVAIAERHLARPATLGPAEGRLLLLQALLATAVGPGAKRLATAGLSLIGDDPLFRAFGLQALGLATLTEGDSSAAVDILRSALESARLAGQPIVVYGAVSPLGQVLIQTGRRHEAEALCRDVLGRLVRAEAGPPPVAWPARITLGLARYEAGDIGEARRELEAGFAAARGLGIGRPFLAWAVPYLALARLADGGPESALEALGTSDREARVTGVAIPSMAGETEARIRLRLGDVAAAARWADTAEPESPAGSPVQEILRRSLRRTVARVRLAQHRAGEAAALLASERGAAQRSGAVADLITVGILEVAVEAAGGRRNAAIQRLTEVVRLAAPAGYVRRFVDDGQPIAGLLPAVRAVAPAFVDEVIGAIGAEARAASPAASSESRRVRGSSLWRTTEGDMVEALTSRELDVLRLVATGASNADIAARLVVSVGTAKWHVSHVLAKLGATSRTQALVRAQQLGLV